MEFWVNALPIKNIARTPMIKIKYDFCESTAMMDDTTRLIFLNKERRQAILIWKVNTNQFLKLGFFSFLVRKPCAVVPAYNRFPHSTDLVFYERPFGGVGLSRHSRNRYFEKLFAVAFDGALNVATADALRQQRQFLLATDARAYVCLYLFIIIC